MSACSGIIPCDLNHIHITLDKHVARQKVGIANF